MAQAPCRLRPSDPGRGAPGAPTTVTGLPVCVHQFWKLENISEGERRASSSGKCKLSVGEWGGCLTVEVIEDAKTPPTRPRRQFRQGGPPHQRGWTRPLRLSAALGGDDDRGGHGPSMCVLA